MREIYSVSGNLEQDHIAGFLNKKLEPGRKKTSHVLPGDKRESDSRGSLRHNRKKKKQKQPMEHLFPKGLQKGTQSGKRKLLRSNPGGEKGMGRKRR